MDYYDNAHGPFINVRLLEIWAKARWGNSPSAIDFCDSNYIYQNLAQFNSRGCAL